MEGAFFFNLWTEFAFQLQWKVMWGLLPEQLSPVETGSVETEERPLLVRGGPCGAFHTAGSHMLVCVCQLFSIQAGLYVSVVLRSVRSPPSYDYPPLISSTRSVAPPRDEGVWGTISFAADERSWIADVVTCSLETSANMYVDDRHWVQMSCRRYFFTKFPFFRDDSWRIFIPPGSRVFVRAIAETTGGPVQVAVKWINWISLLFLSSA